MMATQTYGEFLVQKRDYGSQNGFEPLYIPSFLFDFQAALVDWAVRLGRGAIFADCGMGKTPMQLVWAENVLRKTNRPVLILTPLAVSGQTLEEADKFGIPACRADMGQNPKMIQVTNYEKLHHFDADNYAGVVCDECFVSGTLIDTPQGARCIEDIHVGDKIFTAVGVQKVKAVRRRAKDSLALTTIQGRDIISSENHPYLTRRGWVKAKELREGDYVVYTSEAMRLVREAIDGNTAGGRESFLRKVLLGEMENESARDQGQSAYERDSCADRKEGGSMAAFRRSESDSESGADSDPESYRTARDKGKDIADSQRDAPQASRAGREWEADARTAADTFGSPGGRVAGRICTTDQASSARLPQSLQDRHCECGSEDSNRGGRVLPRSTSTTRARCQEGSETQGARVDRITIYQSSDPGFNRYRDEAGRFILYDLEVEGHPSYSVNGLMVHNSSILKNFDGTRKAAITEFMRKVPYRLLCTATAAPNDWVELGTSSEALGYLGHVDMLTRFFTDKGGVAKVALFRGRFSDQGWRLKGHAEEPFWRWVSSWARAAKRPSDLGFDDDGFVLPPLVETHTRVTASQPAQGMLFDIPTVTWHKEREVTRRTIKDRCEAVAAKVAEHDVSMVWCHLNDEGDLLEKIIPNCLQIAGNDPEEYREMAIQWFKGQKCICHLNEPQCICGYKSGIRRLVSKPRVLGFGLNLQHCAHMTYFPTHSYEQYYQATRRLWRFGQKRPVTVDLIYTDGGERMMQSLGLKGQNADRMFRDLVRYMDQSIQIKSSYTQTPVEVPSWM